MPFHSDQLLLYAVTDRAWTGRQTLLEQLEAALQGGVTLVQLREKDLDPAAFLAEALEVKALCHRYHVPLILNDQVDLALACGADGVHVGSEDLPVAHIRRRAGPDFIIGATAKTVQQAQAAQAAGVRRGGHRRGLQPLWVRGYPGRRPVPGPPGPASFVPPSHSLVPPSHPAASVPPGFDLCTNAAKETPP